MTFKKIKEKYKNGNYTNKEIKGLLEKRIAELSEKIKVIRTTTHACILELQPQQQKEIEDAYSSMLDEYERDKVLDEISHKYTQPVIDAEKITEKLSLEKKDCKNLLDDITFKIEQADLKELSERLDVALKENDRKYIDVLKTRICKIIDNKIDELKTTKERIEKL